ncbi:MAG: glycosyltransferase, partial [Pseudomonadota bacterium]
ARYVARIARQKGCDIIHVRSRAPAWWAFHAARLAGCRFVTTFHGTYTIPDGPAGFFKRRYNAILTKGDLVIAISHFIANHIINHYPTPWGKIRIIARGIDEQRFDPNQVDAARIARQRSAWQLDHHTQNRLRPVILLPGRLTRWKGQMLMIEALARLPRPRPLCVLVGASQGRGRYLQELHQLAQVKGVAEDVRIWQAADDLPAAMMIADLIVSASTDPEAFGRVSAEAMMMGKPIIAPAHGGACEQIDHLKTGFLFQPGSAASLAAGLETMLHLSAPARTAITSHARAKALQQFTCGQMQQKTMRVYDEVMRTRRIIKPAHAFQNA